MRFQYYEIRACVERDGYVRSFVGIPDEGQDHPNWKNAQAEAEATGLPVFWTLYGIDEDGYTNAIGDWMHFQVAYQIMQAILLPMRDACTLVENRDYSAAMSLLDDICNQSSNEDRL